VKKKKILGAILGVAVGCLVGYVGGSNGSFYCPAKRRSGTAKLIHKRIRKANPGTVTQAVQSAAEPSEGSPDWLQDLAQLKMAEDAHEPLADYVEEGEGGGRC
jgi:hypothetical protein